MRFEQSSEIHHTPSSSSAKFLADIYREKDVCPRALSNGNDLKAFGAGVARGAANGAVEFIEFMATPNAVNTTIGNVGSAIGNAFNYYSEKTAHGKLGDVVHDAGSAFNAVGDWLHVYGQKNPYDRGVVCGHAAADMLLAEAGIAGTKALMKSAESVLEPVALENSTYTASKEFSNHVRELMETLPENVHDFVRAKDIKIVPMKCIGEFDSKYENTLGLFTVQGNKPYIYLSERVHAMEGALDLEKLELTLRHELAHAVDRLYQHGKWVSDSAEYKVAFYNDFEQLPLDHQAILVQTLGNGSIARLRRELVAELVSRNAMRRATDTDLFFHAFFPSIDELVARCNSPFITH